MAKVRLNLSGIILSATYACLLACTTGTDATPTPSQATVVQPKPTPSWHGFPLSPGLPIAVDSLVFGALKTVLGGAQTQLLTPAGMVLSDKVTARVVLSKSNTIRYLVVTSKIPRQAFEAKWPGFQKGRVDFRDERTVWLLPLKRIQIHMLSTPAGVELTYIPLTPLAMLAGRPTGTGFTFSSYIGKPVSAIVPILNRMSSPKASGSRLGWAHPLQFETVSLKVSIKVSSQLDEITSIDLFLKDALTGTLREAITTEASTHWTASKMPKTYTNGGVVMRILQTPQLGLRKRSHRNLTLRFSKWKAPVAPEMDVGRSPGTAPTIAPPK
jgi:hypothetical protein